VAEAIASSLSTYANTGPEAIRVSLVNYLKKQIRRGVKVRNEVLAAGKVENQSVLTQCVLNCEELKIQKTTVTDYCVYLLFKTVNAMLKCDKLVINRQNNGYYRVYYEIIESILSIDTNTKREEGEPEKDEDGPVESVFGTEKKLESLKDLSDEWKKWVREQLASNEALLLQFRVASGEDISTEIASRGS
jgi:hypothetical protein